MIVFDIFYRPMPHCFDNELGLVSWCRFSDVAYIDYTFLDRSCTFTQYSIFSNKDSYWRVFKTITKTADTSVRRCIKNIWYPPLVLLGTRSSRLFFSKLFSYCSRYKPLGYHLESLVKTKCAHVINSCCVVILVSNPNITPLNFSGIVTSASGM